MNIRVAVVFGGKSTEHEISVISAVQAMHAFDTERYEIIPVYMTKDGLCYTGNEMKEIAAFQGNIAEMLKRNIRVDWVREGGSVLLVQHEKKRFGASFSQGVDIVFPIVHGTNVEDGALTGFFKTLDVPVVGCDVLSAAVGMDKYVQKAVMKDSGIPVLPCACYSWKDYEEEEKVLADIEARFSYPVIVKPLNLGSSIGISKAADRESLSEALELAFSFAKKILVEPAITNLKEVNCSVLGDYEEATASECESPLGEDEILSFTDKYMAGGGSKGAKGAKDASAKTAPAMKTGGGAKGAKGSGMASLSRKLPADIAPEKREEIRAMAVKAFHALGCTGVVRIDFMMDLDDGGKVYLNEFNTIPGSLSFYLWEASGVPYRELLNRLIDITLKNAREDAKLVYSFDTNVLARARV
ncbi:MAG: D-alanine--D-alanine ligase [Lachnospiraceae bacterium]|nr:D-alanine--D-alanine ligase [Lachnospiraceae bacterium]